jgi:hypothetical protein
MEEQELLEQLIQAVVEVEEDLALPAFASQPAGGSGGIGYSYCESEKLELFINSKSRK